MNSTGVNDGESPMDQVRANDSGEESDDPEADLYKNLTADQLMRARQFNECFICQKRYSSFSKFRTHVFTHTTSTTSYKCDKCFKDFAQLKYLNAHMTIHDEKRSFTCDICSKVCVSKSSIRGHMRVHSGAKPYKCDVCNKAFSESSSRRKHRFSHFPNNPFRKAQDLYTCDICGKIVSYKLHVNAHSAVKIFKCRICSLPFQTLHFLRTHSRIHKTQQ